MSELDDQTAPMNQTFAIYPDSLPHPGQCPVCALPLDELGCRIHEAYLAAPAERARTGITAVYAVYCHGTPAIQMAPCPFGPHP